MVPVEQAAVTADGRSVWLKLTSLIPGRVYMITADGLRSPTGEPLVHPTGACALHQIPQP